MRITFFGSSHGLPEPNRKCSCVLLETGDRKYLIDAGSDPMNGLIKRGIQPNQINAIFITHMHGDHTNGLIPFVDLCSWYYRDADPEIFLPRIEAVKRIDGWLEITHQPLRETIRFTEIHEGLIFDDQRLRVTALRTGHTACSYAFLVECEGKKALFTGDMKSDIGPEVDYARFVTEPGMDLVVAESAHFNAMLYKQYLLANPPKLFCINHYSWRFIESCYHLIGEIGNQIPIVLATDDLEISI